MSVKWSGFGVLALLLMPAMASGIYELDPPQYVIGERWEWNDGEMVQSILKEEPDYYVVGIQVDIQGPQHFWALVRKENAGVEKVWGRFLANIEVSLKPPLSPFPLEEYDEGTRVIHITKPLRMDRGMDYVSELLGIEEITVPAGTFETYHMKQSYDITYGATCIDIWYSPEVRQYVRILVSNMPFVGDLFFELTDYELLM